MPRKQSSTKSTKLTVKMQRFVEEYVVDFNATASAIRAGYTKKSAASVGYENLRKPQIQQAIAVQCRKMRERAQVTAEQRLAEMDRIGMSNLHGVMETHPVTGEESLVQIETHAKVRALALSMKACGQFDEEEILHGDDGKDIKITRRVVHQQPNGETCQPAPQPVKVNRKTVG